MISQLGSSEQHKGAEVREMTGTMAAFEDRRSAEGLNSTEFLNRVQQQLFSALDNLDF